MRVLTAALSVLRLVPWQIWVAMFSLVAGFYGHARIEYLKKKVDQATAAEAAALDVLTSERAAFERAAKESSAKLDQWADYTAARDRAAEAKRIKDEASTRRALRDLGSERDRLRDEVGAFARRSNGTTGSAGGCQGDSITLASLLDEALRTSEACAADGERDAAIARRLLEGRR